MKKALFFLAALSIFAACTQNKKYTIEGTVSQAELEGTNVYLQEMTDSAMLSVDSALIVDGKFRFKGEVEVPVLRFVAFEKIKGKEKEIPSRAPLLLEPGKIVVKQDSLLAVTGTPVNDEYHNFKTQQLELTNKLREINRQYRDAKAAGTLDEELQNDLEETYDKISDEQAEHTYSFVKSNINNEFGLFLFRSSYSMFSPEQQKELLAKTDDTFKLSKFGEWLGKRLANIDNVKEGKIFTDFTMKDPKGKEVSLSDYAGKGKYVLIDFWASWCGPCRAEMPVVVEAYKKYKDKGFEVVGVSLDNSDEKWQEGLQELKMTWPQMSDLKGWQSEAVELYAINGIPHTVLLDKDGIIIEKNLRGEKLLEKLEELLK